MAILGNNDITSSFQTYIMPDNYYYKMVLTGAAPVSAAIQSISFYMDTNNLFSGEFYKLAIWNASTGALVYGDTTYRAYPGGVGYIWTTVSLQSAASIVAGTSYYIGMWGYSKTYGWSGPRLRSRYVVGSTNGGSYWGSYPWVNPLNLASINMKEYQPCMYLTYTSGPSLKIEGITPGKLEYTSWSQISTVR